MYKACLHFVSSNEPETTDLVEWMLSLNLDFLNQTRLATVDPFEMMVRGSLDLGVDVIISVFLMRYEFLDGKRAMKMTISKEELKSLQWRFKLSESSNLRHYQTYLLLFGARPKQAEELASKLLGYERALYNHLNGVRYGTEWETIQIGRLGGHTAPAVSSVQWAAAISKYTNGTYTRFDKINHDVFASELIKQLFYDRNLGKAGLRYVVAWSIFRQLVNFTDPYMLRGGKTAENACYDHIRGVMDLAVVSHYFQSIVTPRTVYQAKRMASRIRSAFEKELEASSYLTPNIRAHLIDKEPLPDAPLDRLFPTWIKARGLDYQYSWKDLTSPLYTEEWVGGYLNGVVGGLVMPTGNLVRPFMYPYGPVGLNYGALGWMIGHEMMHWFDVNDMRVVPGRTDEFWKEYTRRGAMLAEVA
ncbi:hypothetical protein MTO96_010999 [Rhipicephalus appendiculatus]